MRLPLSIVVLISVATGLQAQTSGQQPRSFEVASIRPDQSDRGRVSGDLSPGERLTLTDVSVRELIRDAFVFARFSSWAAHQKYSVNGSMSSRVLAGTRRGKRFGA